MRTRRARLSWYALLLPLVLSSSSYGTLIYNYDDHWDFVSNFSTISNPVKDANGAIIWRYCGGKSTDTPSSPGVGILPAPYDSTLNAWKGSDATKYAWIGSGTIHAESTLTTGSQRTPFLQWVSPIDGHINIQIDVTGIDKNYQAVVFLNNTPIDTNSVSSLYYHYANSAPITIWVGDTLTLRFKQNVDFQSPTANVSFTVTYVVPEPVTISMIGLGLAGLLVRRRNLSL